MKSILLNNPNSKPKSEDLVFSQVKSGLGIVFGIARGILICAILILVIEILKLDPQNSWKNAKLYPVVHPVLTWITQAIPSPKELSQQSLYLKI